MTKKKLHETVLELCSEYKANKALTDALSELTKPKVGGSSNVEDYTCLDADGNVTAIFCAYHKRWEPVTTIVETEDGDTEISLFKASEKSKNGFERSCIEGDKQWKEQAKVYKASKDAIMTDLLDANIDAENAKAAIASLEAARAIHTPRVDGIGSEESPCANTEEA